MSQISSLLHSAYHHPVQRTWHRERELTRNLLMYPIFISDDVNAKSEIGSMPGQYRWGVNRLGELLEPLVQKGLVSVMLFGVPANIIKDKEGKAADDLEGPVVQAVKHIKNKWPGLHVACDVCLCEYTSHGHCGILYADGTINNEASVKRLAQVAVTYAEAGADCVAPSDMMDGRILAIKNALLEKGLSNKVSIMAYSAKFSSSFYGPFRDACDSAPSFGDRKCYQLPQGSRSLALRALSRDSNEGADILMVKPGMPYLDIVRDAKSMFPQFPIAVYQVSGEYAMLYRSAEAGVFNLKDAVMESMDSFLRAGATLILSYYTPHLLLEWLD